MIRGTTPELRIRTNINAEDITKLSIVIRQGSEIKIEKTLEDVILDGREIRTMLTEQETLQLEGNRYAQIQIRAGLGETRIASKVLTVSVEEIIKGGEL